MFKTTTRRPRAGCAPAADARPEELRLLEALLFAAGQPLDEATLARRLPNDVDVKDALAQLKAEYATRGVNLVRVGKKWMFRTADDLSWLLTKETVETRKLSRAAVETLAIIAYHQPVTRAEIEEIRGVVAAAGTLDVLLRTGWIRPRGRRKAPGRPITYGTTEQFLTHFGLEEVGDLPGLDELKGAGLLEGNLPPGFAVPMPSDDTTLRDDEDPLEPGDLDLGLAPPSSRSEAASTAHPARRFLSGWLTPATANAELKVNIAAAALRPHYKGRKSLFLPLAGPSFTVKSRAGRQRSRRRGGFANGFFKYLALDDRHRRGDASVRRPRKAVQR